MRSINRENRRVLAGSALAITAALSLLVACAKPETQSSGGPSAPAQAASAKTGAQLWADNCASCHNAHPSTTYSNVQWEVVDQHMRIMADLTGEDARKIQGFLKGGS